MMEHLDRQKVLDVAQMLLRLSDSDFRADEESLVTEFGAAGKVSAAGEGTRKARPDAAIRMLVKEERVRRRKRHGLLGVDSDVFADPGWDLLLEIFEAHLSGHRLAASTIGLEAGIPQSTALRWLTYLASLGLIVRDPDPSDKRRQLVGLDERAITGLRKFFC